MGNRIVAATRFADMKRGPGRPRNIRRDIALVLGDRFFYGDNCLRCNAVKKYACSGQCVKCSIAKARMQTAEKFNAKSSHS